MWQLDPNSVRGDPSCANPSNYVCGVLPIHDVQQSLLNATFSASAVRQYATNYVVGAPA